MWGVATASYQIEGSPYRAGGGRSVWDMFCDRPGKIHDASSGAVACDHVHRYREDVALMRELGIPHYRFSISWPRVMPEGTGRIDPEGLAFYDRLIDELLAAGVQSHVTLFHWDLPYDLYLRGGWLNRDSADWFADYAKVVIDKIGDRVASWMTLNEPQCFIGLGMHQGLHAPGDQIGFREVLLAGHHALLAHGKGVQAIRAGVDKPTRIGWAPVGAPKIPKTESALDIEAARTATFQTEGKTVWSNTWWNDPVFFGKYPEFEVEHFGSDAPVPRDGDMELIAQPLDFFGANIYNGQVVEAGPEGKPVEISHPIGAARTLYHWPVTPDALYWGCRFFHERYGKPIVITENGLGLSDWVGSDGEVHDPQRIDFLNRYLLSLRRASEDGIPVDGYFQWTLMDNFEWHEGYRIRFGLVHCDFDTLKRTPKESAYWYREVIQSNGDSLKPPVASSGPTI
ncbi:beta-glucosidase [Fimbriimonas ginsengisoli Gsoil 348]|uniref:Beta-glucosidase n=2 Tax=Fimbriimonas ginsengisoli TaxID=1005039 RepID=A0A068NKR9_FIMGI|nr:beta-glucosidase [Fimbriimonas ginsengisoli Gsoil 348]